MTEYKTALASFVDTFRKLGVSDEDLMQGLWDHADVIAQRMDKSDSANYPTNPKPSFLMGGKQ